MREGWEYKNFGEVCDVLYGFAFDSANFCDDDSFPQLVRIRDVVRGFSETYYNGNIPEGYFVERGDYLIGMDGEFNIAPWKSERALLNQRVCKVTTKNDALNRFVYYNLRIILKQIEDETPFVTVKHLSAKRLNAINLYLPPLSVQQSIVSELDMLSGLIAKHEEQLKAYDELAQSIFYDMFGDPVENEKGWEVKKLGEIGKLKSGDGLSAKDFVEGIYPVYGGNGISGYHNTYNMDGNYIVIGRVGAYCGNVRNVIGKFWLTDNAFQLLYDIDKHNSVFITHVLTYLNLHQYANHAAQPVISNITLKDIHVPLPPLSLQTLFAEKIEAIERQKERIRQSMAEVKTLFDSRMDYYFN